MDDWKEILLPLTATIGDAIGVLESSTFKTCLIVDEAENLKGRSPTATSVGGCSGPSASTTRSATVTVSSA